MFTSDELGIISYALIELKSQEKDEAINGDMMIDEIDNLLKKIRETKMKG